MTDIQTNTPDGEENNGETNQVSSTTKTEKTEAPAVQQEPTPKKEEPAKSHRQTSSKPSKSAGKASISGGYKFLIISGVLLSLAAAGGAGFLAYTGQQQLISVNQQFAQLSQAQSRQSATSNQTTSQVSALKNSQSEQQQIYKQLADNQHTLTSQIDTLAQQLRQTPEKQADQWGLMEAHHLVTLAGQKLWLEQDVKSAIALLADGDKRLARLNDAALLPLRKLIAGDIALLKGLKPDASKDAWLVLDGLLAGLDSLPFASHIKQQPEIISPNTSEQSPFYERMWNTVSNWVGGLFRIRHYEGNVEPLLAPEQQWYVKSNLRLQLLQAQLAALKHDQTVFNRAIANSEQWITQWLSQENDPQISAALTTLKDLKTLNVTVSLPGNLQSLSAINQQLNSLNKTLNPVAETLPVEQTLSEKEQATMNQDGEI